VSCLGHVRDAALQCAVAVLVMHGTSGPAAAAALSPEQRQHLDAGEVVVLDQLPPGASGSAQGGTAVAIVCAPPARVWDILVDWPNHPALYPRVTHAEVTQTEGARVRVRYTLAIGPLSFDVHMDKHPDPARRRVTWQLAKDQPSRFFTESSGYWQVDEAGADSLVTHAVATRTLLPAFLTRGSQRDSLVATVERLRTQARKASVAGPDGAGSGSATRPPCSSSPRRTPSDPRAAGPFDLAWR
jgi:hypothetical protein